MEVRYFLKQGQARLAILSVGVDRMGAKPALEVFVPSLNGPLA